MNSQHLDHLLTRSRRLTRPVKIGKVPIGGNFPIAVQSMTSTDTRDINATVREIHQLQEAGCEIVRVAVPDQEAADCLGEIKKQIRLPLIADIHFHFKLAFEAINQGVDKVRINPGNIGSFENFKKVVLLAKEREISMRIGVNSGSVEKDLLQKYGFPSPDAMVESALRFARIAEDLDYQQLIFSIKASDPKTMVQSNIKLSQALDYPLHLGVTEAGMKPIGTIKSSLGIGTLLMLGIGDTIRVSLTGDAVQEIPVAYDILKASGARITSPDIIACPTCGRIAIDLVKVVEEVQTRLKGRKLPIKISILGCVVNGPGEARESDIGIAGGGGKGMLIKKGKLIRTVLESEMVDALLDEIDKMEKNGEIIPLPDILEYPKNLSS